MNERVVTKSCVLDVNSMLSNIVEARDPLIPITVRNHLANKLHPTFAMLNRLEGVSDFSSIPKQGGESVKPPSSKDPKKVGEKVKVKVSESEPKGNVSSGSKGNEKMVEEEEEEENEMRN